MTNDAILKHIDYTILKAHTTIDDVFALCDSAISYQTASVCIPPSYVKKVKEKYNDELSICTVIGFPLGYSTLETKIFETKQAIEEGAVEIDMVINLGDVKNKDFDKVANEIRQIKAVIGNYVLKVIIETCYLTTTEITILSKIVSESGAEYIKTSTGFGNEGATFENIELIRENINQNLKMKASGGIKTKEEMEKYIQLGVERIGVSSIDSLK